MSELVAVPRWVLFFGIANLVLTLANICALAWLVRRMGKAIIAEMARAQADAVRGETAALAVEEMRARPCKCEAPMKSLTHDYDTHENWCLICGGSL